MRVLTPVLMVQFIFLHCWLSCFITDQIDAFLYVIFIRKCNMGTSTRTLLQAALAKMETGAATGNRSAGNGTNSL
jgi:hypothetical protein